jgi:beta-barrel assembly-enhancing protease
VEHAPELVTARLAVLGLLLAAPLAPGCTCASGSVNRGDLNLMSVDDEWALGDRLAAEVDAQVPIAADPVVQAYVDDLGAALAAETEFADRPWTFTAVDDPSVNAFALPGGHVYVHTGLVAAAQSAAELAGVVGHEVAHVAARHGTERMVKAHGLGLVAGLLLGDDPGLVRQIVAELAGQRALARFSQTDELEADALGLGFMAEAGYEPEAMATMFETLLVTRQRRPTALERWFQSHPLTEDRIAALREAARDLPDDPALVLDDGRFEAVRRRVAGS